MTRGRTARLFEGLANAILERGRPHVVAWLQARFGAGADLGALRFEDARVVLEDARVPLTETMSLAIATAAIEVVSVAPPRITLSSLQGEIVTKGGLRAEVRFAAEPHETDAWVHGLFTVVRADWPGAEAPLEGALRVTVTSDRWTITDGALAAAAARIALGGRGDIDAEGLSVIEEAKLAIEGARAEPFVAALRAIMGLELDLGPLRDAIVAGTVVAHGADADLDLTARADLGTVHVVGRAGEAIDARFDGEIVLSRVLAAVHLPARCLPIENDRARCEGTVRGPAKSPRVHLSASAENVRFARGALGALKLEGDVSREQASFVLETERSRARGTLPALDVELDARDLEVVGLLASDVRPVEGIVRAALRIEGKSPVGTLSSDRIAIGRREIASVVVESVTAKIEGGALRDIVGRAWGTELRSDIDGDGVELRFEDASSALLQDVFRLLDMEPLRWPTGLRVSGVAAIASKVVADLAFETEGTALLVALRSEGGAFTGTTVRGRLSLADMRALGWLPSAVRAEGFAKVHGEVTGTSLATELAAARATVDLGPLCIAARDVIASLVVDRDGVVVKSARASAHGGVILAEGTARFGRGSQWNVRTEAVRVDELSPMIAQEIRGLLTGNARFEGGLVGSAQLRLDAPMYPAVTRLAPHLSKVGLPLPRPEGIAPLDATLVFEGESVKLTSIAASLDGITLSGGGAFGPARALAGRFYAVASARYLRESALLAIPSFFTSNVTVPIGLSGTLDAPRVDADTKSVVTNAIGFDPLGAASDLASAFGSIFSPPKPKARPAAPSSGLDVVLDRILDHDPDSEQLISDLVDRGVDPDEFSRLLEARRRARRS